METARRKTLSRAASIQPAAAPQRVQRAAVQDPLRRQAAPRVSSLKDPAEQEADATARKIMRMGVPDSRVVLVKSGVFRQVNEREPDQKGQKLQSPYIARFAACGIFAQRREDTALQRKLEGQPNVAANVAADIQHSMTGGTPLPLGVRRFMEPRFRADFSRVKIHTGDKAARLNKQVNAWAFALGNQIFFGKDQFQPDSREGRELIAHELTHTLQQGGAVQRSEAVAVTETSPVQVQRLGLDDALDDFADRANLIPGFRMFTIILGVNPINGSRVERSAANILRALIEFMPGGGLITQALDNYGIFDKIGAWVEQQIQTLGMTGGAIKQALDQFLDTLSWDDIFDLGGVWERAKRIFTGPIERIIGFAKGLASGIVKFIKDAILRPLATLAEGTRGYDLLKAILGQDPVTGDPVPRNADTLIGGFMKLIQQEEVWNNLKQANAVARAWAWFQGAMGELLGFVRQIPTLLIQAFQSLELADIVLLPRAFAKLAGVFGGFIGRFIGWAGNAVWNLLEIIFAVVAPGAIPYLKKAAGAFRAILQNPIGFIGNLVRAGKAGFLQFAANIGKHLKASLIQWLTGTLGGAGVYIPQAFELREIIKFVLSVLGLTWQNIRQKLVRAVGETVVKTLETGFDIVVTLVTQGPAAAWEKIKEQLSNLKELVMEEIMSFVITKVVQSAVTKLVSLLTPAGAVLQAIIAIYNTIMFFVERLKQIVQVAMAFIDSMAAIASGVIAAAANRVEQTLAGLLTLAISFLARFAGLGKVSDAVINIINKIRAPIDRALDKVVDWIVSMAKRAGKFLLGAARGAAGALVDWWTKAVTFSDRKGKSHRLFYSGQGEGARLKVASYELFTEEFVGKVEKVFADDPLAKAFGQSYLITSKSHKRDIDRLRPLVEADRKAKNPSYEHYKRQHDEAMNNLAVSMSFLIDVLPENQTEDLPVKPGEYVTAPYKGTERKAEILITTPTRVHYKVDAVALTLQMPADEFKEKWKNGTIREYAEGSLREQYLGDTPGKASATGRVVIKRYQDARPSKIKTVGTAVEVEWQPGKWHPLSDCDMSHHPVDAVDYWNATGRHTGTKSAAVRAWMLNPNNYMLEPAADNRSRGAKTKSRYLPPTV